MSDKRKITEEDGVQKVWYEQAQSKEMTLGTLPEFIHHLAYDYEHDYGTICHAIAAGMSAVLTAMNNGPQGGITGFQAGGIMWMVIEHAFHESGPMRLTKFDDMLYPQNESRFRSITADTWRYLQEQARSRLANKPDYMAPEVEQHMRSITDGIVPFGFVVERDIG